MESTIFCLACFLSVIEVCRSCSVKRYEDKVQCLNSKTIAKIDWLLKLFKERRRLKSLDSKKECHAKMIDHVQLKILEVLSSLFLGVNSNIFQSTVPESIDVKDFPDIYYLSEKFRTFCKTQYDSISNWQQINDILANSNKI